MFSIREYLPKTTISRTSKLTHPSSNFNPRGRQIAMAIEREREKERERERPIKREREAEVGEAERARGIEYRAQNVLFHDSFGLIQDQNGADLAGDALFICMDCLQNQKSFIDHNYTLLLGLLGRITPAFLAQQGLCDHK
jgi:hypothetical protein